MRSNLQIPDEEWLIKHLNKEIKENRISQEDLIDVLGVSSQSGVSRILNRESKLTYQQAYNLTIRLLKYFSPIPNHPASDYAIKSSGVSFVYADEPITEAVKKLQEGEYNQLIVKDRRTEKCLGIVTDLTLLERMTKPLKSESNDKWLHELKSLSVADSNVIEPVPQYPEDCSIIEVAEGLKNHYAVLIEEDSESKIGLITRADYLQLLI